MKTKRIQLWSGPRNISTALMYSFAQRADTTIVDEPLYAHYLSKTTAANYHPGAAEVLASQENDGEKVVTKMMEEYDTPIVFFKQMAHHLMELDWSFLLDCEHVILTRDPREMLLSYRHQIETPTLQDIGYQKQVELLNYLKANGQKVIVLDSKQILLNPKKVLTHLCAALAIPFDKNMLHWQAGAREEDGVWAKYWYQNVHLSTGFAPYRAKTESLPEHLVDVWKAALPYYEVLAAFDS